MDKKKILIVDDEPDMRYILRRFLEDEDFNVIEASDGVGCLTQLRKENPDLILLDILMPELNGWEACRQIRESKNSPNIPISMLSVLSENKDIRKSTQYAWADAHMTKPIDFVLLRKTINSLIERYSNPPAPSKPPSRPSNKRPTEFFKPFKFDDSKVN